MISASRRTPRSDEPKRLGAWLAERHGAGVDPFQRLSVDVEEHGSESGMCECDTEG
jgi:hypothetical protein